MDWQCFIDDRTGRGYKSRQAYSDSLIDLTEYEGPERLLEPSTTDPYMLRSGECYGSQVLWEIKCDAHRALGEQRDPPTTPDTGIVLVWFEERLSRPPTDDWQDYLDNCRQRAADAAVLESLRRSLRGRLGRDTTFVYAYGEAAKLRAADELRSMNCRFTETPRFDTVEDFFAHVSRLDNLE